MLLVVFLIAAGVLWASVFGYVGVLLALTLGAQRRRRTPQLTTLPRVAVVIPVRDEETFIAAKLADVSRADYPADRLTTVVVDGGSTDRTVAIVEAARAAGAAVELVCVPAARGKAEQLNAVLPTLAHDVLVITDADAVLDPSCIRELVRALLAEPKTGIVGARVRPATGLLEERVHWWILDSLWWIEGDALGTAVVSGVCYAVRPQAVSVLPADCTAEDIHFALVANARGWRVRLARTAWATELRVPQTVAEFLRFRRRRGFGYARELRRVHPQGASLRWHASRLLRLAHFFVTPLLAAVVAATGAVLCVTGHWHAPAGIAAAFAAPALAALAVSTTLGGSRRRWWRLGLAAGRLAGLTWLALLILPRAGRPPFVQEE